jgi:hypothetical protein
MKNGANKCRFFYAAAVVCFYHVTSRFPRYLPLDVL